MDVRTATVFFTVLTLAANLALVALVLARVTGRLAALQRDYADAALWTAFLVALVATAGSLFYSEVARFQPCPLCWYQRTAMYPLAVVLGIAAWRGDGTVRRYVVPLAAIGALIAAYHYQLEWFPGQQAVACSLGVPCSVPWFRELGFVSLPYMALSAFLLVIALMSVAAPPADDADPEQLPDTPDRINR